MLKRLTKSLLFKTASVYTGTNILNALIPFLLMPVLTRYLTPADYGITAMMQTMIGFLTPFIGLSLQGAIAVKYYKKDEIDFPKYVSSCLFILMSSSLLVGSIFIGFKAKISGWTAFPVEWLWTILLICFGQFLIAIVLTMLQVSVRPKIYAAIQLSQTICNLLLSLWFVIMLSLDWRGRVFAQVITIIIFMTLGIFLLKKWKLLSFSYDKNYIKDALKFGVPLIPHALSGFFITMADRFFITNLISIEATGIYAVGVQIGMAIQMVAHSFNQAYSPWIYRQLNHLSQEMKEQIVKYTYIYFVGIFIFALVYSSIMPIFLRYFLGERFYQSSDYVFGIAVAGAFSGMCFIVANYILYVGKTHLIAYITCCTGILHVLNTYLAIHWFGSVGATYSAAFTSFVTFVCVWILSNRVYKMPWGIWRWWK